MKSPCEVIVWDVLPSIRAALTECKIDVKEVITNVKELADEIVQGKINNVVHKTCEICMKLRLNRVVCGLNKFDVDDECALCLSLNSLKV